MKLRIFPREGQCYVGNKKGQNINLIYCDNITYFKEIISISDNGIIGNTKVYNYSIDLVLEKESDRKINETSFNRQFIIPNRYLILTKYKIISFEYENNN